MVWDSPNRWSIHVIRVGHDMRNRTIWVVIVAVRGRSWSIRCVRGNVRALTIVICSVGVSDVGLVIVRPLNVATVPRLKQIVVRVLLLEEPTGTFVVESGLRLHWRHNSGAVTLSRVESLGVVGLHLEDQVSIVDVGLTGAEGR